MRDLVGVMNVLGTEAEGEKRRGITNFDEKKFKEVLGHFATGVVIVTSVEKDSPVGFTCQSFISLSLSPPMVAFAPAKTSTTWPRVAKSGLFCANILSTEQQYLAERFAISGGEKFKGVNWHYGPYGSPILDGSLCSVECAIAFVHEAGDHELVVANVLDIEASQGSPLLFYRGQYSRFATY